MRFAAVLLLSFAAACGGLSHSLRADLPTPHTLALLPVAGDAPAPTRELARGLLAARLSTLGYRLVEIDYVDRVLSEHGWLADPATFSPAGLDPDALRRALGVDGLLLADEFDESSFNILLLRRHAVTGRLRIAVADGKQWWTAAHKTASTGGLLLQSGQILTELRAQGMHGSSASTVALLDALVEDMAATLPRDPDAAEPVAPGRPARVEHKDVRRQPRAGGERVAVDVRATAGCTLLLDAGNGADGVPMAGTGDHYTAAVDIAAGAASAPKVRVRDPFGIEIEEVTR